MKDDKIKLNVIYFITSLKNCGPNKQLINWINCYKKQHFNFTIITILTVNGLTDEIKNLCIKKNISLIMFNGMYDMYNNNIIKLLNQADIVHSCGVINDLLVAFFVKKAKINTIRNNPKDDYLTNKNKVRGLLKYYIHRYTINNCKNLVFCSEYLYRKHKDNIKFKSQNTHIIKNGVNLIQTKNNDNLLSEELKNVKILLYAGSIIPRKKIVEFARIFNESKIKGWLLLIIGDGSESSRLKAIKSKNVKFIGHKSSSIQYMKISNAVVNPSISEGLPNTVLEALSLNVPVLLSNIGSHKEISQFSSKAVTFFNWSQNNRIKECLNNLLQNVEKMENNEFEKFKRNFSPQLNYNRYKHLYFKISKLQNELEN